MDHTSRKQTFETFAEPTHMNPAHAASLARFQQRARTHMHTHTHAGYMEAETRATQTGHCN